MTGFASRWCARKALADESWGFDLRYWSTQGDAVWPAMILLAESPREGPLREDVRGFLAELRGFVTTSQEPGWRAFQGRLAADRAALLAVDPAVLRALQ